MRFIDILPLLVHSEDDNEAMIYLALSEVLRILRLVVRLLPKTMILALLELAITMFSIHWRTW